MTFTRAVARLPATNAGAGLTSAGLGAPDMERMLLQHREYIGILKSLGLRVTVLDADEQFPDGCFVEDTAIVTPTIAVITRPGAPSRHGEETAIEPLLARHAVFDALPHADSTVRYESRAQWTCMGAHR